MPITAALIGGGASLLGGLMGGSSARRAAEAQSRTEIEAARITADEARFRPIGITTRFGQSQFTTGPDGRVSGASYELTPELRAMQDRFMALTGQGLSQAEAAQEAFAPLSAGAQGLFGLGQQYLAQSPEQAAQQYMARQQDLLAPSRERQMAQLQNRLFQTGREGLSIGATGERPSGAAGLGATTPEMEAYYNAIAQQDATLAAQAQQAGMDQARFGAGLLSTAGNLLTQGYAGQAGALDPYKAYMAGLTGIEALGQDPLNIGSALGGRIANPTGANALLQGGMAAAQSQARADAFNPFASFLVGASQNPALMRGTANLFGGRPAVSGFGYGGYGAGVNPFSGEYMGSLEF